MLLTCLAIVNNHNSCNTLNSNNTKVDIHSEDKFFELYLWPIFGIGFMYTE